MEEALKKNCNELEIQVKERTAELAKTNKELQIEITERKKIENEIENFNINLRDKNKDLKQVTNITSHDLRSPLVNIQGFTKELLKRSYFHYKWRG